MNKYFYSSIGFILLTLMFGCQQETKTKSQSKKLNDTLETQKIDSARVKGKDTLSTQPKLYYVRNYLSDIDRYKKDTVYRYYPDAAISDSLAVVEGLKTKIFGIAISLSKKNLYIFLNDTLIFDKEEQVNPFIHLFEKESYITAISRLVKEKKILKKNYRECDIGFTELFYKGDKLIYGDSNYRGNKFIDFIKITHPELKVFSKFKIGMTKEEFLNVWGFNDIPIENDFTVYISYPFQYIYYSDSNFWFNDYLPMFSHGKEFAGMLNMLNYKLTFKNNKLVIIVAG